MRPEEDYRSPKIINVFRTLTFLSRSEAAVCDLFKHSRLIKASRLTGGSSSPVNGVWLLGSEQTPPCVSSDRVRRRGLYQGTEPGALQAGGSGGLPDVQPLQLRQVRGEVQRRSRGESTHKSRFLSFLGKADRSSLLGPEVPPDFIKCSSCCVRREPQEPPLDHTFNSPLNSRCQS